MKYIWVEKNCRRVCTVWFYCLPFITYVCVYIVHVCVTVYVLVCVCVWYDYVCFGVCGRERRYGNTPKPVNTGISLRKRDIEEEISLFLISGCSAWIFYMHVIAIQIENEVFYNVIYFLSAWSIKLYILTIWMKLLKFLFCHFML